ncbi:MAG: class I SAM-dependent DNA methyltransferase [Bacteroidia bacterium]|nr:class I SAM-dependent DNA methyltransferase [Bacteroidia bacterium]
MALSWNEIKDRAFAFSKEWEGTHSEEADAKPFLVEFFNVFGLNQRKVAAFEHKVKKLGNNDGYIDMLWKGWLLVEMKSKGKDLTKAYGQAKGYIHGLQKLDIPKYVLVCDFDTFRLYDLEETGEEEYVEFKLNEFVNHVELFGFIAGYQKKVYREEDPVNVKAAELMGKLHDRLKEIGYEGHPLEVYLVRLLFCLFAEDTNIFEKQQFEDFIEERTSEDGSDLAAKIQEIFQVLNTPLDKRFKNLDEQLNAFPYVGGKLFQEILPVAHFDSKMRQTLLECCYLDWSKISPAIFGSMFQSVMDPKERRNLGAHYTSEKNILKLIKPLFLDELWAEFDSIKTNKAKLNAFHERLSKLKFLDPACGCGNFLVITYRELRLLELAVLERLYGNDRVVVELADVALLDVDMMAGIEYEEFPARIAEVAMWLMDHQMNLKMSMEFGQYFARLPLTKSAHIVHGNALRIDWETLVSREVLSFIIGNPPFIGKKEQNEQQKADMELVFSGIKGSGVLDYVTAWYIRAAQLIQKTNIKVGLVSTNSISQGEQVGILWQILFSRYQIKIHFAHQTFSWTNEAKGKAAVHVVIIGFANFNIIEKRIFEYEDIKSDPIEIKAKNINPYLVEGKDITVENRKSPICNTPEIIYGSFALDDGNYTLSEEDRNEIILVNKGSEKLIKPFIGGRELLHSEKRYCLWLAEAEPSDIKGNIKIKERVEAVKHWRSNSDRSNTKKLAETPTLFAEVRQPNTNYLAFPTVSSVNRKYIPIAFLTPNIVASNQLYVLPNATLFHFGVLTSCIHMAWVKYICGRLKSDYRYSASIVYNNYPWPENPSVKQKEAIEKTAQKVLNARAEFPNSSLADLYDPLTMPPVLVKAHSELDKAVDLAYRSQPFTSDANRMEFLFELYEKYTAGLFAVEKKSKSKKS